MNMTNLYWNQQPSIKSLSKFLVTPIPNNIHDRNSKKKKQQQKTSNWNLQILTQKAKFAFVSFVNFKSICDQLTQGWITLKKTWIKKKVAFISCAKLFIYHTDYCTILKQSEYCFLKKSHPGDEIMCNMQPGCGCYREFHKDHSGFWSCSLSVKHPPKTCFSQMKHI